MSKNMYGNGCGGILWNLDSLWYRVIGLWNVVPKNVLLVEKWLWRYPVEPDSLWYRVIKSKFGPQRKHWDALARTRIFYLNPWKFIFKVCSFLWLNSRIQVEMGLGRGFGIGEHPFSILLHRLYHLSPLHHALVYDYMVLEVQFFSWNLHFRRNLQDREFSDLTSLMGFKDSYTFTNMAC